MNVYSGELGWILDAAGTDLALAYQDGAGPTVLSHELQFTDGGLLAFVNQLGEDKCTHVMRFSVDADRSTADMELVYRPDPCREVFAMGGLDVRPSGNLVVSMTSAGQIDEITPEGELRHRLNTEFGFGVGYGERVDSLYP